MAHLIQAVQYGGSNTASRIIAESDNAKQLILKSCRFDIGIAGLAQGDANIYATTICSLALTTAGRRKCLLKTDGNVGIGTTTPIAKLSLQKVRQARMICLISSTGTSVMRVSVKATSASGRRGRMENYTYLAEMWFSIIYSHKETIMGGARLMVYSEARVQGQQELSPRIIMLVMEFSWKIGVEMRGCLLMQRAATSASGRRGPRNL